MQKISISELRSAAGGRITALATSREVMGRAGVDISGAGPAFGGQDFCCFEDGK